MAKVSGGGHSDFIKGTISGTTFRGYRGTNIVSGSRRQVTRRLVRRIPEGPLSIPIIWSRYSADKRVTLRVSGSQFFLTNWGDQKFGAGALSQPIAAKQPE